jgi:hypothetical protein
MTIRSENFAKGFLAGGVISAKRIVKFGSADNAVVQAAAATDSLIGVSDLAAASGAQVDVVMSGIAIVEYGGNVTRGALLTADASGKAVSAAPAAGSNNRIVGVAMVSGVSGDLGAVQLGATSLQG